jgi:hypothetical protein
MLKRLGLKRVAYDWRQKHVPTFEQEILEYAKVGLEYFAFLVTDAFATCDPFYEPAFFGGVGDFITNGD